MATQFSSATNPSRRQFVHGVAAVGLTAVLAAPSKDASGAAESPARSATPNKLRKVALEEHCLIPEFVPYFARNKANIIEELYEKAIPLMEDFGDGRLETMDKGGIDYAVLSISGPGVQVEPDTVIASRLARQANDAVAEKIHKRPDRYGAFAHLALQDPRAAADELERCMSQLGFKGALINGATNGLYLDDRRYDVLWERVQALHAPIYLHPANPFDRPAMFQDHPELWGPTWSWAAETCSHALRLLFSGVFDRYPGVNVILGHMGETLPIQLWRLDSRYPVSHHRYSIQKKPSEYIRQNFYITTSGVCDDTALRCALDALGQDRVMFSIDFPFESTSIASEWISSAKKVTDHERALVAHETAEKLLHIDGRKTAVG